MAAIYTRALENRTITGLLTLALLMLCLLPTATAQMHRGDQIRMAAADISTLKDDEILNMAPRLSIEQLTDLLEVYARMDKKKISTALAEHILSRDPGNEAALKAMGRDKSPNDAEDDNETGTGDSADDDNDTDTGDDRTQAQIDALMGAHKYDEVITRLRDMKARQYARDRFPYQYDLADALYQRGELRDAERAFAEILNGTGYEQDERDDAYLQHRELSRLLRGGIKAEGAWLSDDEGTVYRSFLTVKSPLFAGDWRFGMRTRRDHIKIDHDEKMIRHPDETLYETEGFIEKYFHGGIVAGLSAGASQSDTLLGGRFEQTFGSGITWGASLALNQHTDDSLQLEALNGRQDRVNLLLRAPLTEKLQLDIDLFVRRVCVSADRIGSGYGGEINLGYTLFEAEQNRPSLTLSYVGDVNIFSHRDFAGGRFSRIAEEDISQHELLHGFIESRINRHGPGFGIEGNFLKFVCYEVSGAMLYDFTDKEWQYLGEIRLNLPLTARVSLYLGGSYESEGKAGSINSDVFSAESGLEFLF